MNQTKEKIIKAFFALSQEKLINDITVKDISLKANINRSTFYNYYFDIVDLIDQVENEVVKEIKESSITYLKENELNYETILNLISTMFSNYEEYIYIFLIKNNDMGFYNKLKKDFFPIVEENLKLNTNIKNFDFITSYIFNAILGLITHWYDTDKQMPLEEFVNLMFSLIREGFIKYINY